MRQKIRTTLLMVSFFLFPASYYYMSPYLIIEGTLNRIISGSFLFFSLQFLSAFILGRTFCGWVCPAGGAQDIIMRIYGKKVSKGNIIKWLIWTPWITTIIVLAIKNGGYQEIAPFYQTTLGLSIGNVYALITYLLVLTLIVIPAFLIGSRSFCHSICWMAPFMIIGRKLRNLTKAPSLQLSSAPNACVHCHACITNCPMSLAVEDMVNKNVMENSECILCCSCIDGCNSNAISISFTRLK